MILFRWLLLLFSLPLIIAAPSPVALAERGGVEAAAEILTGFLSLLLAGVNDLFSGVGSLFSVSTYINQGGKRIKVTGGRWIGYNSFLGIPFAEARECTVRYKLLTSSRRYEAFRPTHCQGLQWRHPGTHLRQGLHADLPPC
jgi:hypothetical protein